MVNLPDGKIAGNIRATSDKQTEAGPTQNGEGDSQGSLEVQSPSDGKKPTIADRLVEYALASAKLFHTPENEAYATIRNEGHLETRPIRSPEFESWVGRNFYMIEGKVAYSQAVHSALNTLEASPVVEPFWPPKIEEDWPTVGVTPSPAILS